MKWLGHQTVEGLVRQRATETAFRNPGPMKNVSVRLPLESEAKLMVLAEILDTPKATLLREISMSALNEAVQAVQAIGSADDDGDDGDDRDVIQERIEEILRTRLEPQYGEFEDTEVR